MTRTDAEAVLPHLPDTRIVLLSSMDVYQAFWLVLQRPEGEPVPLNEASRVRTDRYPYANSASRPPTTTSWTWSRPMWIVGRPCSGWR